MKNFLLLLLFFSSHLLANDIVRIGFDVGPDDFQKRKSKIAAFSKEIAPILKLKVEHSIYTSNAELVKALKDKKIDFAFLNTMSLVYVEKESPVKILLKANFTNPYYHSVVLVPNNSSIKQLSDLKNKKVAFIDNHSASGYLLPMLSLKKLSLDKNIEKISFTNHKLSIEALQAAKVDAAATYASDEKLAESGLDLVPGSKSKFKVIWISSPIPTNPFVVRQEYYNEHQDFVEEFMMRLSAYDSQKKISGLLMKYLNIRELVLANSKQYEVVRELVKQLP